MAAPSIQKKWSNIYSPEAAGVIAGKSYWICTENWDNQNYPVALPLYDQMGEWSNGNTPLFGVVGPEYKVYYDGNIESMAINAIELAIIDFDDYILHLDLAIDDEEILLGESIGIGLSNYFYEPNGANIEFEILENSNPSCVTASISNDQLTLNASASTQGVSIVKIKASTGLVEVIEVFEFKVTDPFINAGFGNTYNFTNESYIDLGNNDLTNNMELISISAWIKLNNLGENKAIIGKNSTTNNGWYLNINSINKIKFLVEVADGTKRKQYSNSTLPENEWTHIAATYDGLSIKIYINGNIDKDVLYDDYQNMAPLETSNMLIGKSTNYYFDGSIDEVSLWNKGLSHEEVYKNMGSSIQGNEESLIGNWKLDDNFGAIVKDKTDNNEGRIINLDNSNWITSTAPIKFFTLGSTSATGFLPGDFNSSITCELIDNASGQIVIDDNTTGQFTATPSSDNFIFSYKLIDEFLSIESETITAGVDNVTTGINESNYELSIMNYELKQNYPNPFNPITKISYQLSVNSDQLAEIVIYNVTGQKVWSSPVTRYGSRVTDFVLFDGSALNSGIYYYSLVVDGKKMDMKSMVLIK